MYLNLSEKIYRSNSYSEEPKGSRYLEVTSSRLLLQ